MPLFVLDKELSFPPVNLAGPDGLLAMGGDLSPARLLLAYRNGIFPWYEGKHILWWSPDPRFVFFPNELKVSKTMKPLLRNQAFDFSVDTSFAEVIHQCKLARRAGQDGTWITDEIEKAFIRMHELGYAHSAEVRQQGRLVGGLYGIKLGQVFFGESMFSHVSGASRYAFIKYTEIQIEEGIEVVDCQVYTQYLESLGARMIPRNDFVSLLNRLIPAKV